MLIIRPALEARASRGLSRGAREPLPQMSHCHMYMYISTGERCNIYRRISICICIYLPENICHIHMYMYMYMYMPVGKRAGKFPLCLRAPAFDPAPTLFFVMGRDWCR